MTENARHQREKSRIDDIVASLTEETAKELHLKEKELALCREELDERRLERAELRLEREEDRKERIRLAELEKVKTIALINALVVTSRNDDTPK